MNLGTSLTGSIRKIECEPYDYVHPDSGELITAHHRWEYQSDQESLEESIIESGVIGQPE